MNKYIKNKMQWFQKQWKNWVMVPLDYLFQEALSEAGAHWSLGYLQ